MFRCFSGDKVEVKLLIPVCNFERENAIIMATEMVKLEFLTPTRVNQFIILFNKRIANE